MNQTHKTILVITDGIGHNPSEEFNAFAAATKPTYDNLFETTPHALIRTSGLAVGLPAGQMGNSEVGHMTIGSGRILYQNLVKISMALKEGSLRENPALAQLLSQCETIHVVGLLSDGGVHSHVEHFLGVADLAINQGKKVWLHPITDGRDVSPSSGLGFVKTLEQTHAEAIASLSGRFYAMDRDNRWERVEAAYNVMATASSKTNETPSAYMERMYAEGISDEFIEPVAFEGFEGIKAGDGVVFINFRNDRMRQLVRAFGVEHFEEFTRSYVPLQIVTMTQYDATFPFPVMFAPEPSKETLGNVIAKAGYSQFHTAETEKYAHVTFFLNGGTEEPEENETRVLIPSPNVTTYDLQPQMSAPEVGQAVLKAIEAGYDFIVVNFANGDMVGHTGNFEAAKKAVEAVDIELGKVLEKGKANGYNLVITSDHGNCEAMQDISGERLTNHTLFDVYCFVVAPDVDEVKAGGLSNIAPTVLKLMGLPIPKGMDEPLV
ncbi:2,3-bisphosphoglycerate-independent phosphoglycerate mutase [Sulfurospirillum sp. T05]|uniref:2,3-bisphosphoglycerate-independent phosphoglycerate mutase n=1 Tax=Sulfurospirillum tamanense TaxID=2813362 RepID=A0ABS2WNF6_9BACT|nr:2,3-bisphosphoglycerate-independent phosphoglycerate mutase [Sulfurospirillum tamanensis]MBN2963164.1 2,3-bisphosphoglycerate-independent phosphoglycerate mutase [Sulfurospirillum tamanensis]